MRMTRLKILTDQSMTTDFLALLEDKNDFSGFERSDSVPIIRFLIHEILDLKKLIEKQNPVEVCKN